jgi:hypothetical protein
MNILNWEADVLPRHAHNRDGRYLYRFLPAASQTPEDATPAQPAKATVD